MSAWVLFFRMELPSLSSPGWGRTLAGELAGVGIRGVFVAFAESLERAGRAAGAAAARSRETDPALGECETELTD